MLTNIVAVLCILAGLVWMLLALYAPMMAARPIDTWDEQVKPVLWGLVPIGLGVALFIWG